MICCFCEFEVVGRELEGVTSLDSKEEINLKYSGRVLEGVAFLGFERRNKILYICSCYHIWMRECSLRSSGHPAVGDVNDAVRTSQSRDVYDYCTQLG